MGNIETWVITLIIVITGVVAQFAVNKYQNTEFKKQIEALFKKSDTHSKDIVKLQTQRNQYLTTDKADDVYLRRKEFEQFEKHIDKKFDGIDLLLVKILSMLEIIKKDKHG
jgi:Asp-tRNA(Asn)/Glu-tRNA(Gln) amidotransferase A subunit family amidase